MNQRNHPSHIGDGWLCIEFRLPGLLEGLLFLMLKEGLSCQLPYDNSSTNY